MKMLNIWRSYFPEAMFVDLYGPTEITCNCMYYIIDRPFENSEKLPLGKAFPNEEVLFLDDKGKEIKPGETGDICVLGTCLALGYYRDPVKTDTVFVQKPGNDRYPERMYRTGDLAELSEDGQYYYKTRKDFQIKHMGHRIELEEIELYLNAAEKVERGCCFFDMKKNRIVAVYIGTAEVKELMMEMKKVLPKYMLLNLFLQVAALPFNKNGKLDRKKIYLQYREEV